MKPLILLTALAFAFVSPADASAPTINSRVAKLERQVKRLNTDMYKCLGETIDVYIHDNTLVMAGPEGGDVTLLVVSKKCVH